MKQPINIEKNKYDSLIVYLYSIGREDLLPEYIRKQVPYSTATTWRKTDYSSYIGHEFRQHFERIVNNAEITQKLESAKKFNISLIRSWYLLKPLLDKEIKKRKGDHTIKLKLMRIINSLKPFLGLERTLQLMGISKNQYYHWSLQVRFSCIDSYTSLCAKRHPHQLHLNEIKMIKKMLLDPALYHWPIVSISAWGLRQNKVVVSNYSWYKYAALEGIRRKLVKKDRKTIGIVAHYPNEYWHVDTTYYPLARGGKACIAIVMDNYSKIILGYHIADKLNFSLVKSALTKAIAFAEKVPNARNINLVADGGRENHNQHIEEFLNRLANFKITKLRSLKDIRFSNSPVEAVHRTLKGRYLRNRQFMSVEELDNYLQWVMEDYNLIRPHYKHAPKTPYEVYGNKPLPFNLHQRKTKALYRRVQKNKCVGCLQCTGSCKRKMKVSVTLSQF